VSKASCSKRNSRDALGSEDALEIKEGSMLPPLALMMSEVVHYVDGRENELFDTVARGEVSSAEIYPM